MDKDLKEYTISIAAKIDSLAEAGTHRTHNGVQNLYKTHIEKVKDFQHERFIHLVVTLFFAGVMLLSFVGTVYFFSIVGSTNNALSYLSAILTSILLITTLAYVYHYYKLENGTQNLYKQTDRLIELLLKSKIE